MPQGPLNVVTQRLLASECTERKGIPGALSPPSITHWTGRSKEREGDEAGRVLEETACAIRMQNISPKGTYHVT